MKKTEGKITYDSIGGIVAAGFDAQNDNIAITFRCGERRYEWKLVSAESGECGEKRRWWLWKKFRRESAEKNQTRGFQDFNG